MGKYETYLKPGRYQVGASAPGYDASSSTVDLGADQSVNLSLSMIVGDASFFTDPPGAMVVIDGKATSTKTPGQLTLPVGSHTVSFSRNGLYAPSCSLSIERGKKAVVQASMKPVSAKLTLHDPFPNKVESPTGPGEMKAESETATRLKIDWSQPWPWGFFGFGAIAAAGWITNSSTSNPSIEAFSTVVASGVGSMACLLLSLKTEQYVRDLPANVAYNERLRQEHAKKLADAEAKNQQAFADANAKIEAANATQMRQATINVRYE